MSAVCQYCKGELPDGAVKCRSCGEWIDGASRLTIGGKIAVAVVAIEIAAMAAIWSVWIPALDRMYRDLGSAALPQLTKTILHGWWSGASIAAMVAALMVALVGVKRPAARGTLLAITTVGGGLVIAATLVGAYLPIFQLAGAIRS
jgi:type II secretory pathway component PulF